MIKKILKLQLLGAMLITTSLSANTQNGCENSVGCKKKACSIEKELVIAKKMENSSQIEGLEISLKKVKQYCTNDKLVKELEDKIDDKNEDLKEHKKDYEEASKENKADKIKKYQSKIDEDNKELKQLQQELKELN